MVHIGLSTVERRVMELAEAFDADLTVPQLEERDKEAEQKRVRGGGSVGACWVTLSSSTPYDGNGQLLANCFRSLLDVPDCIPLTTAVHVIKQP